MDGEIVEFYAEAEDILSRLPKLGIPMIMRRIEKGERKGDAKVWSYPGLEKMVQQPRKAKICELRTVRPKSHNHFAEVLEHFPERWTPAFRKKMRPIKDN